MADFAVPATPVARHATGAAYDLSPVGGCGPHRVFVFVPAGPAPATGWPLLVTTDGNATFELAVGMMRSQALDRTGSNVEDGIVVSVGYPTDGLYDQVGRCWDLSPPPGRRYPGAHGAIRTGGAAHFLAFLETQLLPLLETMAPLDPRRRTLSAIRLEAFSRCSPSTSGLNSSRRGSPRAHRSIGKTRPSSLLKTHSSPRCPARSGPRSTFRRASGRGRSSRRICAAATTKPPCAKSFQVLPRSSGQPLYSAVSRASDRPPSMHL